MLRLTNLVRNAPDHMKDELHQLSELQSRIITNMRAICKGESVFDVANASASEVVHAVLHRASFALSCNPAVTIDPAIDDDVDGSILSDLAASLRECLSNVARHARATSVTVEITIDPRDALLVMTVTDNGHGIDTKAARGSGLANIRERAIRNHGHCEFSAMPGGGTSVEWCVPLDGRHVDVGQYGSTGGPDVSSFFRRVAAV